MSISSIAQRIDYVKRTHPSDQKLSALEMNQKISVKKTKLLEKHDDFELENNEFDLIQEDQVMVRIQTELKELKRKIETQEIVICELKKENKEIKQENKEIKQENKEIKGEVQTLKENFSKFKIDMNSLVQIQSQYTIDVIKLLTK
jgi:chromosome segregation ATPase